MDPDNSKSKEMRKLIKALESKKTEGNNAFQVSLCLCLYYIYLIIYIYMYAFVIYIHLLIDLFIMNRLVMLMKQFNYILKHYKLILRMMDFVLPFIVTGTIYLINLHHIILCLSIDLFIH